MRLFGSHKSRPWSDVPSSQPTSKDIYIYIFMWLCRRWQLTSFHVLNSFYMFLPVILEKQWKNSLYWSTDWKCLKVFFPSGLTISTYFSWYLYFFSSCFLHHTRKGSAFFFRKYKLYYIIFRDLPYGSSYCPVWSILLFFSWPY